MPKPERALAHEGLAEIIDLSSDGRGVARVDGKVMFITGALPGETVRFRRTQQKRHADEGRILELIQASSDRIEPKCVHYGECGGCALQHLNPERQVEFKQKQMLSALRRIGGVVPAQIAEPITDAVWGYRRKARLAVKFQPATERVLVGFRERHGPALSGLQSCEVLDIRVAAQLAELASMLCRLSVRAQIPQLEFSCAETVAMVIRALQPPTAADLVVLREFAAATGFELYLQYGKTATPLRALSDSPQALRYSPDGGPQQIEFEPLDFIQVNAAINRKMVLQAMDWLAVAPGGRVLELFSGVGNFSLPLAARGALVTAVEGDAELVKRAKANAERNGHAIRHAVSDLYQLSGAEGWLQADYDAVLLDPPRNGVKELLPLIAARRPERILYVSCHPGSLARDAATLVKDFDYRCERAGIMDMFPHTDHVESMALFVRGEQR